MHDAAASFDRSARLAGRLTGLAGCVNPTRIPGTCEMSSAVICGASAVLAGDKDAGVTDEQLGLVGYTCNGEPRPDDKSPRYDLQGVPYGQICADMTPVPPDGQPATGGAGLLLHAEIGSGELRAQPKPARRLSRGLRLPVLRPQPPGGEQPRGDVRQRPAGGRLHPLLLPARAATGRLRAGQGRHDLHGRLDRLGLPDHAGRIPAPRRGLRRQREPRRLLLLRVRRADARAERRDNVYCCFSPSPVLPGGSCVYSPGSAPDGIREYSWRRPLRVRLLRARQAGPELLPAHQLQGAPCRGHERHWLRRDSSTAATTSRRGWAPAPAPIRTIRRSAPQALSATTVFR